LREEFSPYDIALHDLAGVILDKPVYELLGNAGKKSNKCYTGMIYFDDLEPAESPAGIDKVMENCQSDYDRGYRQFKVKIGRGNKWMEAEAGLARDIEITRLIAKTYPDCDVLVDGNNGFEVDQFLRYMRGIGDVKLFWIEEPFQEEREGLLKLKDYLEKHSPKTLIAEGEAGFDKEFLLELERDGLVDVFIPDICGYGFTKWRKLMAELRNKKILTSPHTWGSLLKSYYTAHLAAGMGNVVTIEGVTCDSGDIDLSGYKLADGMLRVADGAGFGMKLLRKT
jgi:L-alanine-DL-glutamate epimerase-like enolase superfamily enzyme